MSFVCKVSWAAKSGFKPNDMPYAKQRRPKAFRASRMRRKWWKFVCTEGYFKPSKHIKGTCSQFEMNYIFRGLVVNSKPVELIYRESLDPHWREKEYLVDGYYRRPFAQYPWGYPLFRTNGAIFREFEDLWITSWNSYEAHMGSAIRERDALIESQQRLRKAPSNSKTTKRFFHAIAAAADIHQFLTQTHKTA